MLEDSDGPVRVAVGILEKDGSYLLCQRGINRRYALKWEFPGGKAFPDESLTECLVREIEEELGITPVRYKELVTLRTTYPDGGDFLITYFLVTEFSGEIVNKVFEKVLWLTFDRIRDYDLLDGTRPILAHLT